MKGKNMKLKNIGPNVYDMVVTKTPISAPQKSPNPEQIPDPSNPGNKIPNPHLFVKADRIVWKKGETLEFGKDKDYNEEQGEYLYKMLGVPEHGGIGADGRPVTNKNYIIELDDKGEEKKDNLFIKTGRSKKEKEVFANTPSAHQFEASDSAPQA